MLESATGFVTATYLRSVWNTEFEAFVGSPAEAELVRKLRLWSERTDLGEASAQPAFIQTFFCDLWGYHETGTREGDAFTLWPQFAVAGAGESGGVGQADLAMGLFQGTAGIPQVLCEYKGIKTALDVEQRRKGSTRSPVRQSLDYLSQARRGFVGSEPILPTWAVVSDMNEFRLYWYDRGASQNVTFVIKPRNLFDGEGLLADSDASCFARFAFSRLFHRDMLLTEGGRCELVRLIHQRRIRDREIEEEFYQEYRNLREALYAILLTHKSRSGKSDSKLRCFARACGA